MKFRPLLTLPLLFASFLHCTVESDDGEVTDTRSNWLQDCDADAQCGGELSCHCGVCTVPCERDTQCARFDENAVCETTSSCTSAEQICLAPPTSPGSGGAGGGSGGSGGRATSGGASSAGGDQATTGGDTSTGGSPDQSGGQAGASNMTGSGGTGGSSGCLPNSCEVRQNATSCAAPEPFKIIWTCPDANPPAEVLDDCIDMATGLPRWCCPETTLPQCVPAP